jgi:hypothetical protein
MILFHWSSEALKAYRSGHITVMAENVEEARQKVRDAAMTACQGKHCWLFNDDGSLADWHDEQDMIDEFVAKLEADIAAEPTTDDLIFINGGE